MRTTTILGIALVGLVIASGVALAAGPAAPADPANDAQNSPWVTGDERLERFQERFGLTDGQLETVRSDVLIMIDDGATRAEVRATVTEHLESFGVEDPELGPIEDRQGDRFGSGAGHGPSSDWPGPHAPGGVVAPHGPAHGPCQG